MEFVAYLALAFAAGICAERLRNLCWLWWGDTRRQRDTLPSHWKPSKR